MSRDTEIKVESKKKWFSVGAGFVIVFFKFFGKLLKMTKVIKAALIAGSVASYAYLFTWEFAVMIVGTILFHEYGHFVAMKQCGIKTKGIYMIPFVGGAAIAEENFKSRRDEAYIALMGPWFGLAISIAIGSLYYITHNPLFAVGGAWMAMINLFNLLPVNPLDGGRVIKSIAFSMHSVIGMIVLTLGLVGGLILAIVLKSGLFILIVCIGGIEMWLEWRNYRLKRKVEKLKLEISKQISWEELSKLTVSEEDSEEIKRLEEKYNKDFASIPEMPSMNNNQMIGYFLLYILTALVLAGTMAMFNHIPGASLAGELLK